MNASNQHDRWALKARYIFPVAADPIADGVVTIAGDRIVDVGTRPASADVIDLGNVAILPGLVNAHTHLEFSDLTAPLGTPGMNFVDWIGLIIAERRGRASDSRAAIAAGLAESASLGTTTVGEILSDATLVDAFSSSPCDTTSFAEIIGLPRERFETCLKTVGEHLERGAVQSAWRVGLSPHAPYSVRTDLVDEIARIAASRGVPLAMHLAESTDELDLLATGGGAFRRQLEWLGVWDSAALRPGSRVLDYLEMLSAAPRSLVIHGNYLDAEEIAFLAAERERMSVIYCPRTHAFFRHPKHPLDKLLAAGARVALGTDSRASSPDLSLLAELRHVAAMHDSLPLSCVLRLGTLDGARALGLADEIGLLSPAKRADLAIVALPNSDANDPHDLVLRSSGPVVATICRGQVTHGADMADMVE